jgi:uncharacterized repeat protein (TIGR03803 family)
MIRKTDGHIGHEHLYAPKGGACGRSGVRRLSRAALIAAGMMMSGSIGANAATFTSLYKFKGAADGAAPYGELVPDSKGILYGTTAFGGALGRGTVFSLTHVNGNVWKHKVLYSFQGEPDGANPYAGVIIDPKTGVLFGTTGSGGVNNANCSGCGTVFKLTPNAAKTVWTETVLYRFKGGANDGSLPQARLLLKSNGVLYGTTTSGGPKQFGTAFSLTPKGALYVETIIHKFTGGADGGVTPNAGLIFDKVGGALLGIASRGGTATGQCSQDGRGCGSVFRLTFTAMGWALQTIYKFKASNDGMEPSGPLAFIGNYLYGSTRLGGLHGQGSVFKLTPHNAAHTLWSGGLIYSFKAGIDGKGPMGVTANTNGHLFGLTEGGGNAGGAVFGGTLYELTPPASGVLWTETVRHRFTGGADGADSQGTLLLNGGVFYGTGNDGGDASSSGTFFKYLP